MRAGYDVAIVGGGVIGSAIACFLAAERAFGGSILVVEKDPGYTEGSTARSAGGIRQQFSTPENIEMSRFAIRFLNSIGDYLAVDGETPEVGFIERGYLFLATEAGLPALRRNHQVQRAHGADVALLTPAELKVRLPWIDTDGLGGGSLGLGGEGWLDPYALLRGFRRKARSLGVTYAADEAIGLERSGARVTGLVLANEGEVGCGVLVNAAGPRAAEIAAMAGIELPVQPRKRMVYVIHCRETLADFPLLVEPNGVWARPEGGHFICGVSPPAGQDPDTFDFEIDYGLYEDLVWPTLAHRVPAFESVKLVRAWAGHYAYNSFDQNAVLGFHPELDNFCFANGFSGHGLQQAPAVGRGISELIAFGEYRGLDLSRLDYARIAGGRPVRELAVV